MSATLPRTRLSSNHIYVTGDEGANLGSGSYQVDEDGMRRIKGAGGEGRKRKSAEKLISLCVLSILDGD